MIVMKFGGTSVARPAAIRQVGQIVKRFAGRRPVVVVSALAGVTDDLLAAAEAAARGKSAASARARRGIESRHLAAARGLGLTAKTAAALHRALAAECAELQEVLHGVYLLREPSRRSLDLVASFGERLSARL